MNLAFVKDFSASGRSSGYDETSYVSFSPDGRCLVHSHMRPEDVVQSAQAGFAYHPHLVTHVYDFPSLTKRYTLPPVEMSKVYHPFHFFLEGQVVRLGLGAVPVPAQPGPPLVFFCHSLETGEITTSISPPLAVPLQDGTCSDGKSQLFFWQKDTGGRPHRFLYSQAKGELITLEEEKSTRWQPAEFSFSSDGTLLRAIGFSYPTFDRVYGWDTATGRLVLEQSLPYMAGERGVDLGWRHSDNTLFVRPHTQGLFHGALQYDFIRLQQEEGGFRLQKNRLFTKDVSGFFLLGTSTYYLMQKENLPWGIYQSDTHQQISSLSVKGEVLQATSSPEEELVALLLKEEGYQVALYSLASGALLAQAPLPVEGGGTGLRDALVLSQNTRTLLVDFQGRQSLFSYD